MAEREQTGNTNSPKPRSSAFGTQESTRRQFIGSSGAALAGTVLAVGGAGTLLAACGSDSSGSDGKEVVVMGWSVYMTPEIQKQFTEATGLTMKAIPADDDQTMFTKVKAGGGTQYDIVFANSGWAPTYLENNLIEKINLNEIDAAADLYPIFREDTSFPHVTAPNEVLLYPNMWSAAPMMWNSTLIEPSKPYTWNALWDAPEGKVLLHGAPEDFLAMAGLALGVPLKDIYAMSGAELESAANYLAELKPFQISPNSDEVTASSIASGKAEIGFVSSFGVAFKANNEFTGGEDIVVAQIPDEGTLGWVDGPQLVKDAKNRDNALAFIDFFGGYVPTQDYLWDQYFFAQCSQVSTERIVARGGSDAQIAEAIGGNTPELSTQLEFLRPPDDPAAWAKAYDQVIS